MAHWYKDGKDDALEGFIYSNKEANQNGKD
jgi:hypothetical protein